jgi:acetyl esterase
MPLDLRTKRFLDALAAGNPADALTVSVAQRRSRLAELMKLSGPPVAIGPIEDRRIPAAGGELLARVYTPLPGNPLLMPGLVYFHGGGLVAGSIETHEPIARSLAGASQCRIVSVEYRLAPEHPYPAALDDALAAIGHVVIHASHFGIDAARLGVCGDSAGGTLAAAACHALARAGGPRLRLQLLLCPILDYGGSTASRRELASGYLVDEATLQHDLRHCLPAGMRSDDVRISPLRGADFSGLPPTIIHTAEYDPLRDEGRDYYSRLEQSVSALSYTCHPGMIHLFYGLGGVIPYARTAITRIGNEIRAALA